jgi:hypothetical protein
VQVPQGDLGFASQNMLKEVNLEGLVPGASYTIELISYDFCARMGSTKAAITMPWNQPETSAPLVSVPTIVRTGFQTSVSSAIHFSATDDIGIERIAVYINGMLVKEYSYFDGKGFRWWTNPYTLDSVQSTLEGPNLYVYYPNTFNGQYALIEIVATDVNGNTTTTSARLWL